MKTNAFSAHRMLRYVDEPLAQEQMAQVRAEDSPKPPSLLPDELKIQQIQNDPAAKSYDFVNHEHFSDSEQESAQAIDAKETLQERFNEAQEIYDQEIGEYAELEQDYHLWRNRYDNASRLVQDYEGRNLNPEERQVHLKLKREVLSLHQKAESIRWAMEREDLHLKRAKQDLDRIRAELR